MMLILISVLSIAFTVAKEKKENSSVTKKKWYIVTELRRFKRNSDSYEKKIQRAIVTIYLDSPGDI